MSPNDNLATGSTADVLPSDVARVTSLRRVAR